MLIKESHVVVSSFVLIAIVMVIAGVQMEQEIHWPGLVVILLFYALIFFVGIWAARRSRDDHSEDFLLAGRKLPLWIAMLTMAATWLGGGYINGTAEAAAHYGLVWAQAPWGYGLSLILGGLFFARKMRRHRFRTMLDPLSQRFGDKSTGLFFLPALLGEIFWIAAILTALGTTFSVIIGFDTQFAIVCSAIIAVLYTFVGGLWAVAFTDVIQLLLIVLGLFLVIPFLYDETQSFGVVWNQYTAKFGSNAYPIPNLKAMGLHFWNWLDMAFLLIFGGIPWQVYFQRVLASKNENQAMWLSILAGFICLVVAIPAGMIGVVSTVTEWSDLGLTGPDNYASTLPYAINHLTPLTIALLGLGAISAAVMSSIDSSMLSASTMAIWNVYKPLLNPKMDDKKFNELVRKSLIIICISATLLSLKIESVYALWYLCGDFVYCLLFPALTVALFDPKANRVGVLSGFFVSLILRFGGGDATLGLPIILPYPMIEEGVVLFPFRSLSMISGLLTMIVISRMTQKINPPSPLIPIGSS